MSPLARYVLFGAVAFAAVIASLYVVLAAERGPPADSLYVEKCRDIARQVMDLYVEAARSSLDDAESAAQYEQKAAKFQDELEQAQCNTSPEKWMYGSFQQEMIESERYVADTCSEKRNCRTDRHGLNRLPLAAPACSLGQGAHRTKQGTRSIASGLCLHLKPCAGFDAASAFAAQHCGLLCRSPERTVRIQAGVREGRQILEMRAAF